MFSEIGFKEVKVLKNLNEVQCNNFKQAYNNEVFTN